MKKHSFTLAEVLITIVVIGIIAAITVPVVMANHKRTETASKLKKFYSTMSNAIALQEIQSGLKTYEWQYPPSRTYDENKEYIEKYILNNINYVNYEPVNQKYISELEDTPNFSASGCLVNSNDVQVHLNDGSMFSSCEGPDWLMFDVNGDKGPNKFGRDVFVFAIIIDDDAGYAADIVDTIPRFNTVNSNPIPWEDDEAMLKTKYSRDKLPENCQKYPNTTYCTHLVEVDGWEFKDDYPVKL